MVDYDSTTSFLLTLREAAKVEQDARVRGDLRQAADELAEAIKAFSNDSTGVNLTAVVGLWSRAMRHLSVAGKRPTGGGAGLQEGAQLAA